MSCMCVKSAKETCSGSLRQGDFVWGTHTNLVLDPSHEKLKDEFSDVTRTYIPMRSILRIDEVRKQGTSKITSFSDKVTTFPSAIYTPSGNPK